MGNGRSGSCVSRWILGMEIKTSRFLKMWSCWLVFCLLLFGCRCVRAAMCDKGGGSWFSVISRHRIATLPHGGLCLLALAVMMVMFGCKLRSRMEVPLKYSWLLYGTLARRAQVQAQCFSIRITVDDFPEVLLLVVRILGRCSGCYHACNVEAWNLTQRSALPKTLAWNGHRPFCRGSLAVNNGESRG